MTPESIRLVVATPCYGGMVTQRYMQSICSLLIAANNDGLKVDVELLGNDSLITRARNTLVTTFLDKPDATHLMFIDADIGFTIEELARLVRFDRDVVAGMYPLKIIHHDATVLERVAVGERLETALLRYVGAPLQDDGLREEDGFVTAEYAGTGFMLIKRQVFERMKEAYPGARYLHSHDRALPNESRNQYAFFDAMVDPDSGHYLSEDYAFCRRWRAIGGEVWIDTRSKLMHIGPREFAGDAQARFRL